MIATAAAHPNIAFIKYCAVVSAVTTPVPQETRITFWGIVHLREGYLNHIKRWQLEGGGVQSRAQILKEAFPVGGLEQAAQKTGRLEKRD